MGLPFQSPWTCNFNSSAALSAGTIKKVLFKDQNGNTTRAKEIFFRVDAPVGNAAKINYRAENIASTLGVTSANQFVDPGGWMTLIKFFSNKLSVLTADAGDTLYIDAYSDEDITGTTFA